MGLELAIFGSAVRHAAECAIKPNHILMLIIFVVTLSIATLSCCDASIVIVFH